MPGERTALSYKRLRMVNDVLDDPEGLPLDVERLTALHEWAGPADPTMGIIASIHYNLFLGSVVDHDHAGRDLGEYARMSRTGTFLCTEVGHGNSAIQLETTATRDPETGGFILHTPTPAAGKFMPNTSETGGAKTGLVAARLIVDDTDHGVFLFLTPLSDDEGRPLPGVGIRRLGETSTSSVDHCLTTFTQVSLPFSAFLQSDHGRLTTDGQFSSSVDSRRVRFLRSIARVVVGKLCMSACSLGVSRQALAIAVRYGHTRQTSGMKRGEQLPLAAYRTHHATLLHAVATTYAATFLHRGLVRRWSEASSTHDEDLERLIAISKAWTTEQARAVMLESRERCGARGLFLGGGIASQLAAIEGAITAEGDNRVILAKAAGQMLVGGFTPSPASVIPPSARELDDPVFLQDLLEDIERIWHLRARTRLRAAGRSQPQDAASEALAGGATPLPSPGPSHVRPSTLERWNGAAASALTLVNAHVHRLAAEALLERARTESQIHARNLLHLLHRLFALRSVGEHSGDLLAESRLTVHQVKSIPDEVDAIVSSLAPHAPTLTRAFQVPAATSPVVAVAHHEHHEPPSVLAAFAAETLAPVAG